jgi:hypothetical protein
VMDFNQYACNSMRKLLLNNGVDVMLLHAWWHLFLNM